MTQARAVQPTTAAASTTTLAVGARGPHIDYGDRCRLGMLLPSGNIAAEPQIKAMLPPGVALYTTRLPLTGSSEQQLLAMIDNVEGGARLLADARVDLVAFNCTAVSTFDTALEASIKKRLADAAQRPVTATSEALLAALRALGAKRIVLVTPYIRAVNEREARFFDQSGFEVIAEAGMGIDTNAEMGRLPAHTWVEFARKHRDDRADVVLVSCTAIRSAEVIEEIERELQRPVLTSNQALVWHCLRSCGIRDAVHGFGRLLANH